MVRRKHIEQIEIALSILGCIALLFAVTRCSPIAPSQDKRSLFTKNAQQGDNSASSPSIINALSLKQDLNISDAVDTGMVVVDENDSSNQVGSTTQPSSQSYSITLSNDEWSDLFEKFVKNGQVDVEIDRSLVVSQNTHIQLEFDLMPSAKDKISADDHKNFAATLKRSNKDHDLWRLGTKASATSEKVRENLKSVKITFSTDTQSKDALAQTSAH